ncbi:MAG: hypothetical protein RLZZ436_2353 [Planctomycetota bacterium]|jgi:hypothetical protein
MNKYVRGILYFLVLVGLGGEFYFAARVLTRRFNIETTLAKAIADSTQAVTAEEKARLDLLSARAVLASVKNGWSYEWEFLPGGNAGGIQPVAPGRLNVSGLGRNNGLNPVAGAAGAPEVAPTVHVYALTPQNSSVYIGEFVARVDQLQATTCVLEPTWRPRPQELAAWNFANGVRFRREVPPGPRNAFAGLNQTILRSLEKESLTDIHIQQQTQLNADASAGLDKRKKELIGDPDGPAVPDHPEYTVGLVTALRDAEEERNAVQAAVDYLRRALLGASQKRQSLLDSIRQIPPALTRSGNEISAQD